jgi:outer membrane protein assembly factor BamB
MFHYNSARSGVSPASSPTPGDPPWTIFTGNGLSSPVVAEDGTVYIGGSSNLTALNPNGTVKWTKGIGASTRSTPAISPDGDIIIGSGSTSDRKVYAYKPDGTVRWTYTTGADISSSACFATDGTIYIGGRDSYLYALDAASGKLVWRFAAGQDSVIHNQVGFQSSPAVVDGVVYVGCRDAHLYAIDARTGKARWAYPTQGAWVITSPAVRAGHVYFGTGDSRQFVELDARTGQALRVWPFNWYLFASPAIAGGLAYVAGWDGKLTAIDLTTRKAVWTWQTDASRRHLAEFSKPDGSMRLRPETRTPPRRRGAAVLPAGAGAGDGPAGSCRA